MSLCLLTAGAATWATVLPAFATVAFAPYQSIVVGSAPASVAIGDFNGDGRNDVAMSTTFGFDDANDFSVFLFVQRATGALAAPTRLGARGQFGDAMSLAAGDVDGDGRTDLVLATGGGLDVFVQGRGHRGLGAPTLVPTTNEAFQTVVADVDGDDRNDLVASTRDGVVLLHNDGNLAFTAATVTTDPQWQVAVADLTGDGRPDVAGCSGLNLCTGAVNVFRQDLTGGTTSWPQATYPAQGGEFANGCGLGTGDLTGDGLADVALSLCANGASALINVFGQAPDGTLAAPVAYPSFQVPAPVVVADVNGDARSDVVTLHEGWLQIGVYEQQPGGGLATEELFPIPGGSGFQPTSLAAGDIDSDGKPDLVYADLGNGLVILRQQ